jgi:hypothetical protein
MIQHDTSGEILFAHTTAMKTTNALELGTTWEAIQYFQPSDSVRVPSALPSKARFIVGYPITIEYSGGQHKTAEEGGEGPDTFPNPCLELNIINMTVTTDEDLLHQYDKKRLVDSFNIVTQSMMTYKGGKFGWFESKYYELGGKP